MLRPLLTILSGNVASSVLLLFRNILVARMLSLEDFGIASTFILAMSLVEMMSALGLQQQLVQAKNGGDPHLQAALQGFQAMRGVMNAIFLFLLGGWIADFFQTPEAAWAYRGMAVIPLVNGFLHFDTYRMSRQMNYLPTFLTTALPPLASVLAVPVLYRFWPDYRVMLFALIIQISMTVVMSHLVAKRAYRLAWDRGIIRGSLKFGWPLLSNGALMFLIFNGERAIVGRELGMEALALFGMAFSLSLAPTLVMANTAMSFFLPQLSAAKEESVFRPLCLTAFEAHFVLGGVIVLGVAILGGPFIHFALGERYAASIPILTWMAIMQAARLMKGGCSTVAMSRAFTANAMAANLIRVALLPLAWWVVSVDGDLRMVIWIGIAGELLGLGLGLGLAFWRLKQPAAPLILPLLSSLAVLVVAGFHANGQHTAEDWIPDPLTSGLLLLLFTLSLFTMRDLRSYVRHRRVVRHTD